MMTTNLEKPWERSEFHERLLAKRKGYHLEHPFQLAMNEGTLTREQIQIWVVNRFYYHRSIPLKDAFILSQCPQREFRRRWIKRILDHDGFAGDPGGVEAWLQLGLAAGISREDMEAPQKILPGVRFAVDAYVHFSQKAPWQEGVCSSLTELFAQEAHKTRLAAFRKHYPWIREEGLGYFENRLLQLPEEVDHALPLVLDYADTREKQERALDILQFKMDVLWSLLDAVSLSSGFFRLGGPDVFPR